MSIPKRLKEFIDAFLDNSIIDSLSAKRIVMYRHTINTIKSIKNVFNAFYAVIFHPSNE